MAPVVLNLLITREYYPTGTNGQLSYGGVDLCKTIELPWRNNERRVSCIPEGRYRLQKRFTASKGNHLAVENVPGRSDILIHAANDAEKELLGCIAPVLSLAGPGKGYASRTALANIVSATYAILNQGGEVWLTIKK